MDMPIIFHIDFDSFFASVEQQDHPWLRNKPIGVTPTNGGTCIIAASREAKQFGIKTGTRTYNAMQICPWITLTKGNFWRYLEISKKFLSICNTFSPTVELFSIDEVFMDVTETIKLFGSQETMITLIKKRIKEELGSYITVSIGVSYNKLLAKLASGIQKPDGVYTITQKNIWHVYKNASLTDMCGIGQRLAQRLNKIGIYTLLHLRDASLSLLEHEFGKVQARKLKDIGIGRDDQEIIPYTKKAMVKSISRNYCLPYNQYDKRIIYQTIFALCEEIGIKLRRLKKKAKTVGLSLQGSHNFHARKTTNIYYNQGIELFSVCKLVLSMWDITMVRMISVIASNLTDEEHISYTLFDSPNKQKLQQTIDMLNERFGDHTIHNGFLLYSQKLTTVPNGYMADTYERSRLAENIPIQTL
jgi:DNA polymerase-4